MKVKLRISDIILNLIISILLLSMFTLTVLYAVKNTSLNSSDSKVFDKLWITQDSEDSAFSVFDISYCTPHIIMYKQPGSDPVASVSDSSLSSTLYSVLSDAILDVLGSDSVCISEGVDYNAAANKVLLADSYILFEYDSQLPYQYIYALTSAQSSVSANMCAKGPSVNISKIALLLSEKENGKTVYECYAFDSAYNAYKFEREDQELYSLQKADKIYIDAYADTLDKANFNSLDTTLKKPSLEINHKSFDYSPLTQSADISMLRLGSEETYSYFLKHFRINPEKINVYTDRDGSTMFIGTGERLSVSADNTIEYTSENSSIPLKEILGYIPTQTKAFSLFDMLKATNIFISDFRDSYPEALGKNAEIKLTGVYKTFTDENDNIAKPVFEYSYFYNGIRIDTSPAFRFVFDANGICTLNITLSSFSTESEKGVTLPKSTVYDRIKDEFENVTVLRPIYSRDESGIYHIKWAAWQ